MQSERRGRRTGRSPSQESGRESQINVNSSTILHLCFPSQTPPYHQSCPLNTRSSPTHYFSPQNEGVTPYLKVCGSFPTKQLLGESRVPNSIAVFAFLLNTSHLLCSLLPPRQVTTTAPTWQKEPSRSKVFKRVTTWVS